MDPPPTGVATRKETRVTRSLHRTTPRKLASKLRAFAKVAEKGPRPYQVEAAREALERMNRPQWDPD